MIAARQIFLGRGGGGKLPYDAEVEYLESTGNYAILSYIDTGIVPTIDTSAELEVMEVTWAGWAVILGSASSDNNADSWYFRTGGVGPSYSFRIDGKSNDNKFNVPLNTRFGASCSKDTFSVEGNSVSMGATAYSTEPTLPMYLFDCNLNGNTWGKRNFKGRVYSCRIWDGGRLVRDFRPVRFTNELGQSEGAMYDRVSGQLFRNQGTGAFTYGNDK